MFNFTGKNKRKIDVSHNGHSNNAKPKTHQIQNCQECKYPSEVNGGIEQKNAKTKV